MKKKPPEGIPLESLFTDDGFEYNGKVLFLSEAPGSTDPRLKEAMLLELISNAGQNVTKKVTQKKTSSKGGESSATQKRVELQPRNKGIIGEAKRLLDSGHQRRELAGMIAKSSRGCGLSVRQIRNILKDLEE